METTQVDKPIVGQWTTVDKTTWGPGPWQDEPDKVHWIDEATDLDCLIVRGPGGHWCGYVAVTEGHPAFEQDYDAVHDMAPKGEDGWSTLSVHGGLTYADHCTEDDPARVCHVPQPGRPDRVWWLGFDCAHAWDMSPAYIARYPDWPVTDTTYRDRGYVEGEVRSLAAQLKVMVQ